MHITIGEIAERATIVTDTTKCEEVYNMFLVSPQLEGIVICTNKQPIGLIMQTHFYQKLSTRYGYDLFINRTVDLVMDKEPLIVDYSLSISEVSTLAMGRKQKHIYDYVIVTTDSCIYGIVSIKNLLIKLAEVQVHIARYSNPLTGLPGNYVIEEKLGEMLTFQKFSVMYIDIDSFKVFNDTFGFREGDELIRHTANIINETIMISKDPSYFVGHIGGDDFIAVIPHFEYEEICKSIISRFDHFIRPYYSPEELEKGYIQAISRRGILENIPLVSISIAVITNTDFLFTSVNQLSMTVAKVKKSCKAIKKSVFLTPKDCIKPEMKEKTYME